MWNIMKTFAKFRWQLSQGHYPLALPSLVWYGWGLSPWSGREPLVTVRLLGLAPVKYISDKEIVTKNPCEIETLNVEPAWFIKGYHVKLQKLWQVVHDREEDDWQNVDQGRPRLGKLEIWRRGNIYYFCFDNRDIIGKDFSSQILVILVKYVTGGVKK